MSKYRVTPHATTEKAPCELFLDRKSCTRLHVIRPSNAVVEEVSARERQKRTFDKKRKKESKFTENQLVLVKDFRNKRKQT